MEFENYLQVGFSRVDITPPLGIPMAGYYDPHERLAETVLDPLELNTLAVSDGERTVLLFSADLLYIRKVDAEMIRRKIEERTGVPYEAIFIACTHTHTGPIVSTDNMADFEVFERNRRYKGFLADRLCDGAVMALKDRKPAKMGYGVTKLSGIAQIRRFRMKNGTVRTNPAAFDPNIIGPAGEVDERVNVLRFVRAGGKEIAVANFGIHACCMKGGTRISADFPRFVRETVEAVMPAHCIFFSGAQGDVNHFNPFEGPKNQDPFVQAYDLADQGYNYSPSINAKYIGRAIAGALFQVYGNVKWSEDVTVRYGNKDCLVATNMPEPGEVPWAEEFMAKRAAGEPLDQYPPHSLARAGRILRLRNGPEADTLPVSAVRIGPAAFVGIPGEPFTQIGVRLKENSPFAITLPCCLVNGGQGYYPMQEDYAGKSYEAVSSNFKAGVAEALVEAGSELMEQMADKQ